MVPIGDIQEIIQPARYHSPDRGTGRFPLNTPMSHVTLYVHPHGDQLVAKGDRFELVATGHNRAELQENVRSLMARECPFDVLPVYRFCCGIIDLAEVEYEKPDQPIGQDDLYLNIDRDEAGMHARTLDDLFQIRQLSGAPEAFRNQLATMVMNSESLECKPKRLILFLDHHETRSIPVRPSGAYH